MLSLKVEKLSQHKKKLDSDITQFISDDIQSVGIKWTVNVDLKKVDNEICIDIYLGADSIAKFVLNHSNHILLYSMLICKTIQ